MKTVIITGANGNLGTAVTREFLDKNYRVIATVSRENARGDLEAHPHLDVEVVNLMEENETTDFIHRCIQKYQQIDAALMLVGGFAMGGLAGTSGADIHHQIALNFETAYYVTRPLFAHFLENKRGNLVFIGARPALLASQGKEMIAYALSKSLLFKMAELLNETARGMPVSASVVVPSTLDTPLNRQSMPEHNPEDWVKPSAVAEILEFLISEKSQALKETVLKVYNNA